MKVTEIQINDLVGYNGFIGRVYATSMPFPRKEERYNDKAIITLAVDGFIDALETEVEPIPLTAEILEKNGWIFMEGQDYSTFPVPSKWIKQFVPFALKVNGETYNIANTFTIKYVHELQHALRLCGLNELANNFKI